MFKKIWNWITKAVKVSVDWVRPKAVTAATVVNTVKDIVESPVTSAIVAITPTSVDDVVLKAAKAILPQVAEGMLVAENILQPGTSAATIVSTLVAYLRTKSKPARAKWWTELQAQLTVALADNKISLSESISIGQLVYQEISGKDLPA